MPRIIKSAGAKNPSIAGQDVLLSLRLKMPGQNDTWHHQSFAVTTITDDRFAETSFKGLIGMNLLCQGWLEYSGPNSTCEIRWKA